MKVTRIDHVALVVRDMDAAIATLTRELGLELAASGTSADKKLRLAYLRAGDGLLQLITPLGLGEFEDFRALRGPGLHHVCFEVADVEDAGAEEDELTPVGRGGLGARVRFRLQPLAGLVTEYTSPATLSPAANSAADGG